MRFLLKYLKPLYPKMALEVVIKLVGTLMDLALPLLLTKVLNDVAPTGDKHQLIWWGIAMGVAALLCWLMNVGANRMSTGISRQVTLQLRRDLFARVEQLSCAQADNLTVPSLVSRMTSDTYNVHQLVDRMQRLGVRAPISLIGGIVCTLLLDPVLALVLIVLLPPLYLLVTSISRRGVPLYANVQGALDKLTRKVQENMSGVRVVKALSKGDFEKNAYDALNLDLSEKDKKAGIAMALSNPAINFMLNAGLVLVLLVGAWRVNGGLCKPGTIIAFLSYFTTILNAVLSVTRMFVMYSKGAASARRIGQVLDMEIEPKVLENSLRSSAALSMEHVSFSYNKKRDNLQDVSFALNRGQTLGIIGATGSGKSTLLSLILRLYDADKGTVYVDGQDVRTIDPEVLYAKFGVVFQNDFLFADTLRENISFGRNIPDADILAAIQNAQGANIKQGEGGLDFSLAIRGANLSGGQKQRVLIARALAAKPEILLLDDCSSALDYKTDADLRHALKESLPDSVKVIVSQRVSAIKGADEIIVLDGGRVIGQGRHEELLENCPVYRDIYDTQMGQEVD